MIKLIEFKEENYDEYIKMYNEFIQNKSDLIPDVLELECKTRNDYKNILVELTNRKIGKHEDIDWYKDSYYFLGFDNNDLIGIGCIRNNLTQKGYDIWGNIAYGVRPSQRKKGYGTKIAEQLVVKCKELGMKDIILCHYEDNIISTKIFSKIGAEYTNSIDSTVSNKKIKRYKIELQEGLTMKNKLLILAYMGTGKTELEYRYNNVVDLDFQDYKYIYDESIRDLPLEQRKGQTSLRVENPDYPNNFINAVLNELEKDKIVVSPFIEHVFKAIDSDNFKNNVKNTRIILVFPMSNNFGEYVDRFKKRGNNEEFILRRKKEFTSLIELFEKASNNNYEKIIIKPKQYLSEALIEYGVNLKER